MSEVVTKLILETIVRGTDSAVASLGKITSSFDNLKNKIKPVSVAAAAMLTGMATAAILTAREFANLGESLEKMSLSSGISIGALSAFKVATDNLNMPLQTVTVAIRMMQRNMATMGDDATAAEKKLGPLGIRFQDLKNLAPEEQMMKIGNAIAGIEDPAQRTSMAITLFGRAGTQLLPFFADGKTGMDDLTEAAKKTGLYMDELAVDKAKKLDKAMDDLNTTFGGIKRQIVLSFVPAITDALATMQPFIQRIVDWISINQETVRSIIACTGVVLGLTAVLYPLMVAIGAVGTALVFLAANPVVLIIGAIAALTAGIVLLIQNWDAVKLKFETDFPFLTNVIKTWSTIAVGLIGAVRGELNLMGQVLDAMANKAVGAFNSYTNAIKGAGSWAGTATGLKPKALGGPVSSGESYMVGESGPEMFVPNMSGSIVPNSRMGGTTVNISINTMVGEPAFVEKLGQLIVKNLAYNVSY